jgi:DNA-binding beta-propeller fold protein YncE
MSRFLSRAVAALFIFSFATGGAVLAKSDPGFHLTKSVPLGGSEKWDYLVFDDTSNRVFIAHGTEVTVVDGRTGVVVGRIGGLTGAHGIALVTKLGRGYVSNNGLTTVFDLATYGVLQEIPTDAGADAVIYDPASERVFVMNGKAASAVAIDPTNNTIVARVALGGRPEFAAVDGNGHLFVNIEDKQEIVRLDSRRAEIEARWPISECQAPHGLSMDKANRRLFVSCVNSTLLAVDADNGKVVAKLPIGKGTDATAFDSRRKYVFSSNGEGTLSIFEQTGPDAYRPLSPLVTAVGARTMTLDPESGRVFLVTADVDHAAGGSRQFLPGTLRLMILDPQD